MKPIKLEIQGIHSFVENQVFDFDNISGNKMFGIFGPTGSGKSTVLDAIVLALYGNVWRSKSNADFINLKAKKAKVDFEFSCIEKGRTKTYAVQRTFNLNKDGEALQKAQVFEVSGSGRNQIMEGVCRVDLFLTDLIGLNQSEFSKCIALPQGEFAGFLKAKPSERISIIGGIFDLNKYGEELAEKVRERVSLRKNELVAIESQLAVYSGVSQEDIVGLQSSFNQLKEEIEADEKMLASYEITVREEEDLAALQSEYDKITGMLSKVLSEGVDIADKRLSVARAKKINDTKTLIETASSLSQAMAQDSEKIAELKAVLDGEKLNLGGIVEDNKRRVEVLEMGIKILLDKHIALENAKNNNEKLEVIKQEQNNLLAQSEEIEFKKIQTSQEKHDKENLLGFYTNEYDAKRQQADELELELRKYEDVVGYRLLENHKKFVDGHIKFLDVKINRALNLKSKSKEKIDELLEKEDEIQKELYALRIGISHGSLETKIDDATIRDELYKKMLLLDKLNVTEEYIANLMEKINSLKLDNEKRNQIILGLEEEKEKKSQIYQEHNEELYATNVEFDSIIKNRLEVATQNAVAEFTENCRIGDPCPICGTEMLTKNVMSKLNTIVTEQSFEKTKENIGKYNQRKLDELYKMTKLEQNISAQLAEIKQNEKEIARLEKEIIARCSRFLNKKNAKIADLNVIQIQVKNEVTEINRALAKESKILEKIKEIEIDKIKYNTAYVSAVEKCTDYTEILGSLTENKLQLEKQMLDIVGDSNIADREKERRILIDNISKKNTEIENLHAAIVSLQDELRALAEMYTKLDIDGQNILKQLKEVTEEIEHTKEVIKDYERIENFDEEMFATKSKIEESKQEIEHCNAVSFEFANKIAESENKLFSMCQINEEHKRIYDETVKNLLENFAGVQIYSIENLEQYEINPEEILKIEEFIESYDSNIVIYNDRKVELESKIAGRITNPTIIQEITNKIECLQQSINKKREDFGRLQEIISSKQVTLETYNKLCADGQKVQEKLNVEMELAELLRGKALLEYVAEEFIDDISYMATEKIQELMDGQYVLKYEDKEFYVVDNFNDGNKRSVNTLSGGEVFVVSLALALAISDAIMSRSDKRIDFFFLDEGFGTLDKEYCEYIVGALTKLSNSTMTIGLISHIPELQERIEKKFLIQKATEKSGSKVHYTETY